jgi:hypothetical protein
LSGVGGGYTGYGGVQQNWEFTFHTRNEPNPFILIDLGKPYEIESLEIINRKIAGATDRPILDRARTLTAWTGPTESGPWEEVWRAQNVQPQWIEKASKPTTARYVKLGLRETGILHLHTVKVFGKSTADVPNWNNAIDLLALFNRDLDTIRPNPNIIAKEMHTGPNAPMIAQFPYIPPEEYDVRMEVTTPELKGWIVILLSKNGKAFRWGVNRMEAKFDAITGSTPVRVNLPINKRSTVLIQVRNDRAVASIDGVHAGEVAGKYYTEANSDHLPDKRLLGITTHNNPAVIHKFEVIEVNGKGSFLRPDDPAAKEAKAKH